MRRIHYFLSVLSLIFLALPLSAQDATCPTLVQTALENVSTACEDTGRNQLCYGNPDLIVTAVDDAPDFTFEATGDVVDITLIDALQLSALTRA
jgi:hypothetical protein